MPIQEVLLSEAIESKEDISNELIAKAFYEDVRNLGYNNRHGLMDRFDNPELFNSGKSSKLSFFKQGTKPNDQKTVLILFTLLCRFLNRLDWQYLSGNGKPMLFNNKNGPSQFQEGLVINNQGQLVGLDNLYGRSVACIECSTLAFSFGQVLAAFNFPLDSIKISSIRIPGVDLDTGLERPGDGSDVSILATLPPEILSKSNNIFGVNVDDPVSNDSTFNINTKYGLEQLTNPYILKYIENLIEPNKLRRQQGIMNGVSDRKIKEMSPKVVKRTGNIFGLEENGLIHPTGRDVFENHFCTKLELPGSEIPYYDPLYMTRYKNGLTDLFEQYDPVPPTYPIFWDKFQNNDNKSISYRATNAKNRSLVSIPTSFDEVIRFQWYPYDYNKDYEFETMTDSEPAFMRMKFDFQKSQADRHLHNIDYLELVRVKHNDLYFFNEEEEYTLPMEYVKIMRQMAGDKSIINPRDKVSFNQRFRRRSF